MASPHPNTTVPLSPHLRAAITESDATSPIIHHLNADSSWLIQIPHAPSSSSSTAYSSSGERKYFNILLDPWLSGPQSDVASWFSKQWHSTTPAYPSIAAVEDLCWEVEGRKRGDGERVIDIVGISHEFTDHCHEQTLREVHPETPIFANDKAITLIQAWKHFTKIHPIPSFTPSWLSLSSSPLPAFLSLSRLQSNSDFLYYHSAILISFLPSHSQESKEGGQCIIYTPHGLPTTPTSPFTATSPPLNTLALLHGLHDVSIPWTMPFSARGTQQLNLGAHNALKLQRMLEAKYWISTHDEEKKGGGVVGWILQRKVVSLEEALKKEEGADGEGREEREVKVIDLRNGEGMVLE